MKDLNKILEQAEAAPVAEVDEGPTRKHDKVRPDPAAIDNLHRLQANRPLKPPGRS